jgi:hypothetical protein
VAVTYTGQLTPFPPPYIPLFPQHAILQYNGVANPNWTNANEAKYVPFSIQQPIVVRKMVLQFTTVAASNYDIGIYTVDGARVVSLGSTAVPGATGVVEADIADTMLTPGSYYYALVISSTSPAVPGVNYSTNDNKLNAMLTQTSALPLPSTATFAVNDGTFAPVISLKTF